MTNLELLQYAQRRAANATHPLVKASFEADVRYLFGLVHSPLFIGVPAFSGAAHELEYYQ
jgi:hypothetical protein